MTDVRGRAFAALLWDFSRGGCRAAIGLSAYRDAFQHPSVKSPPAPSVYARKIAGSASFASRTNALVPREALFGASHQRRLRRRAGHTPANFKLMPVLSVSTTLIGAHIYQEDRKTVLIILFNPQRGTTAAHSIKPWKMSSI